MDVLALDINPTTFPAAKLGTINQGINVILPLFLTVASLLFLFMFFLGAFQWLRAEGSSENVKKAHKTISYAVFGLVIVFSSYLIVKIIGIIFKINNIL